jgi:hypothetical protein
MLLPGFDPANCHLRTIRTNPFAKAGQVETANAAGVLLSFVSIARRLDYVHEAEAIWEKHTIAASG